MAQLRCRLCIRAGRRACQGLDEKGVESHTEREQREVGWGGQNQKIQRGESQQCLSLGAHVACRPALDQKGHSGTTSSRARVTAGGSTAPKLRRLL